jgi:CHAT domain-containing protein
VRSIKNIIGGDLMLGMDASETTFKEIAYRYRVLHLAMHALIDDDDPLNTKLVFSEDSLEEQDGFLNVYEIYGLNLNAQMVVLSGCKSGTGMLQHGEGIMSLARAFFYCGVPNVIMTLWTVYDESGEMLMTRFYRDLVKGNTKETALRNAKLNFLETAEPIHQHPYFWSGFVIIGDNEAVFKPRAVKFLLIGLLFIIAIFGILYKNRLSRKKGLDKEKEGLQAF